MRVTKNNKSHTATSNWKNITHGGCGETSHMGEGGKHELSSVGSCHVS